MTQVPASSHGAAAFNGGTITNPLVIDVSGDATGNTLPLQLRFSYNNQSVDLLSAYNVDHSHDTASIDSGGNFGTFDPITGAVEFSASSAGTVVVKTGFATQAITSGALPTVAVVSGTPFSPSGRDIHLLIPFTGDATNNAATLKIEVSPDGLTYSTLDTLSIAAALNLTGAINVPVDIFVPGGWFVKLTATHGTIGTATYY